MRPEVIGLTTCSVSPFTLMSVGLPARTVEQGGEVSVGRNRRAVDFGDYVA